MFFLKILLTACIWIGTPHMGEVSSDIPVNKIIPNTPEDLDTETLLIPRFDFMDVEDGAVGKRRQFVVQMNRRAKEANTTLNETIVKAYPYKYKLVSLGDIDRLKAEGYRYFLDMAMMPKQMKQPKPEALIPAYEKFRTANKMYNNRNRMWHHYFYIRDLKENDAYITQKFKGNAEVYRGISQVLKQFEKDLTEE